MSDIIKKGYKIDENLVIELLERLKNNDDKNDLFLYISDNLKDKREVENLLIFLEEGESYIKLLNGKNPSFKLNESNRKILEFLKEKNWISSFKKNNNKYYSYGKRLNNIYFRED